MVTPAALARLLEAASIVADNAPQLARLARAAERQADAATLAALVQYRAHLGPDLELTHSSLVPETYRQESAARAIADASIRALGRRLAVQAAARGDSDAEKDGAE